jgi:hypothetical protein
VKIKENLVLPSPGNGYSKKAARRQKNIEATRPIVENT